MTDRAFEVLWCIALAMVVWAFTLWKRRHCKHRNISWCFSTTTTDLKKRDYVVCHECQKRFWYNWEAMTMGKEISTAEQAQLQFTRSATGKRITR